MALTQISTDGIKNGTITNADMASGLDADTLGGVQGSSFLRSDANDTSSGTVAFGASALDPDSFAGHSGGFGGIADGSGWSARGVFVHGGGTGDAAAMAHNGGALYFGIQDGANTNSMQTWLQVTPGTRVINFQTGDNSQRVQIGGNKIFHAGNDGGGSGLDADLLDGVQGSSFLRSDATDTCSGQITFTNQIISVQDGDKSTQGGSALVLRHSTNAAMRANHFIHDDFPSGSATYYIQATEAGVSNDRNMCLQGYGGKVKIGGAGNAPTEKLDVAGNITVSGRVIANKLSFDASDTDTFIDRPNANQIEITVANKEVATFIDGSNNRPAMLIDKDQTNNGASGANFNSNGNANDLVVGNVSSNNHGITICTPSTGVGTLNFSDGSGGGQDAYKGSVSFDHSNEITVLRAKTGNIALRRDATDTLLASSSGITITGNLLPEADNTRNIGNGTTNFNSIWASTRFRGNDDVKLVLGDSQDFVIRHDGTQNIIGSPQGHNLQIKSGTADNDNQFCAEFKHNGAVDLYWNNGLRASTDNQGLLLPSGKGVCFGDIGCKVSGVPGGGGSGGISFMVNSAGSWKIDGNGVFLNNNRNEAPSSLKGAIHFKPSASGGSTGILFNSNVNANSDCGYIWWYDDNNNYRINDSSENGALVIGIQNDGNATSEDAVAIESSGNIFLNPGNDGGLSNAGGNTGPDFSEGKVYIGRASTKYEVFHAGAHSIPSTNNTFDLGSTSLRFRNVYTNDLNLSNEGGSNDVDGTWGSYTIQEGAEDLFLVNKRNGKKYKFNLTEVS